MKTVEVKAQGIGPWIFGTVLLIVLSTIVIMLINQGHLHEAGNVMMGVGFFSLIFFVLRGIYLMVRDS